MFLKNAWYVAAMPDELAEKPLGRTICGEKMVFYRGAGGKVAAVEDFCPHRGAQRERGAAMRAMSRTASLSAAIMGWRWAAKARRWRCRASA